MMAELTGTMTPTTGMATEHAGTLAETADPVNKTLMHDAGSAGKAGECTGNGAETR